jgi:hypothetical protein
VKARTVSAAIRGIRPHGWRCRRCSTSDAGDSVTPVRRASSDVFHERRRCFNLRNELVDPSSSMQQRALVVCGSSSPACETSAGMPAYFVRPAAEARPPV